MVRLVRLGRTAVAATSFAGSVDTVMQWVGDGDHHLVVTPNVDHLVLLERDQEFDVAYQRASLRVPDGAPLVTLARLCGRALPERITGVDLTAAVLDAANDTESSVFLLGGKPEVLTAAVEEIRRRWPRVRIAGWSAPDIDLDIVTPSEASALEAIRATSPDVLLIFLGAPKQEKWYLRRVAELPPGVALAVGGTVDILAGARRRAPRWWQDHGLEWLWRCAQEPRRLAHRYFVQDSAFFGLAARQLWRARVQHAP